MSEYFTTKEVARLLKLHPVTLRKARCSGELCGRPGPEFIKLSPRRVLYPVDALEAWVDQYARVHVTG